MCNAIYHREEPIGIRQHTGRGETATMQRNEQAKHACKRACVPCLQTAQAVQSTRRLHTQQSLPRDGVKHAHRSRLQWFRHMHPARLLGPIAFLGLCILIQEQGSSTLNDVVGEFATVNFQRPELRFLWCHNSYFLGRTRRESEVRFHRFLHSPTTSIPNRPHEGLL